MQVAVFSTKPYDRAFLESANKDHEHEFVFFEARLTPETVSLAKGFPTICIFVNDQLDASMIEIIAQEGTRLIALRCAGFNNVDLAVCLIESNLTVGQREECVVSTHTYVLTWVETCAALAEDDVACDDGLTAEFLNTEALRVAVASVLGSSLSFFV